MFWFAPALLAIAAVFSIIVGLFVLARDHRSSVNRSFFGISIGIFCWSIGIAGFLVTENPSHALLWVKFYYIAPIILVISAVFFTERFVKRQSNNSLLRTGIVLTGITLALLLFYPDFMTTRILQDAYSKSVELDTVTYSAYSAYILAAFALILHTSWKKIRFLHEYYQIQQARMFFFGFGAASVLGLFFNLILPYIGNYSLITLGPIATSIFIGSTAYSIVRHHMFDIKIFVVRAVAYSFTTLMLALIYIAPIIFLVFLIFGQSFEPGKFVFVVSLATLAATNYGKLRAWFDRRTNRIFFRDSYDPTALLGELNRILVSTIDLETLLRKSGLLLSNNMKADYCVFVVWGSSRNLAIIGTKTAVFSHSLSVMDMVKVLDRSADSVIIDNAAQAVEPMLRALMQDNSIGAFVRLVVEQQARKEQLGYLILGQRMSGKSYDAQDRRVLVAIANTLTIAMQNALRFEEIQQFNVTLQGKVDEATRKLRASNEKLKKLDETKDEFISMASHQLRTPLTSVKGYLSMVLEGDAGPLKPQQRELLKQSFLSSERMVNLIADLLNLSRLNTGKFVIDAKLTDLRMIVDQEVAQLRESAKAKNISFAWDMPQTFSLVELDEGKMHQVVMNFIDNAIYYTPEGGSISVGLTETDSSVEFRVKDSGIGIPRDVQHKLFGKFYRADNARRMRPDGTGLGLYMAKKVVIAQGGSIIFESVEGKGSTFGFRFAKNPEH